MEVYMELSKKTTILLTRELHRRLTRLAKQTNLSMGELIRTACERQYGIASSEDRLRAVRDLAGLSLPVGTPRRMKREAVPAPDELLP